MWRYVATYVPSALLPRYTSSRPVPTFSNSSTPLGPQEVRGVDDALLFGRQQWQALWAGFAAQFSQPALIKLAELTLGSKAVHSSQIHGWSSGKLRDPSPKLMLALGELNLAIAKANGVAITSRYTCPGAHAKLWEGKTWLKDAQGAALGPAEVFQAIAGLIDLGVSTDRLISTDDEEMVSKALGKYLRIELAKLEIDWMDDIVELRQQSTCIEDLLMGRKVKGAIILQELDNLAGVVGKDADQLWSIAIQPVLS